MSEAIPVGRILTDLAAEAPSRPAITVGERTVSRAELESLANRWARGLHGLGVGFGDLVTIALPNGIDFVVAAFATWKLGAVPQPVSPRLPDHERDAIVELADARVVIGVAPGRHAGRICLPDGWSPSADLGDAPLPDAVSPSWKAPTSGGSTGRPKLILSGLPGKMPRTAGRAHGMEPDDVQLVAGPLYHNAPFSYLMLGLHLGQHVVLMPRFDAAEALRLITAHRVTYLGVVPTMMLRMHRVLVEEPAVYDLSSVRMMWHTAAPCPAWLKDAWIDRVGGDAVCELYGGTEAQAFTTITGTEWKKRRGSVGRAASGEIMVAGDDGKPVPPGVVGEIFMRPRQGGKATYRYVGADARTIDGGWESIGDLGWMDSDGYLYLSDRRSDLVVSGGVNIYPAEVEAAIDAFPGVVSSVVVGVPDDDLGQRLHAFVEVEPASPSREIADVLPEEIRAFLAERLVAYKIPRSFNITTERLRDDAGKVRRSTLRDRATAALGEQPAS